jgi:hypothetical protein
MSMAPTPAPPQVGIPVDKAALDSKIGANAQGLKRASVALADLYQWQEGYTAQQLVDLYGYSTEEANLFKSACGEIPAVRDLVDGLVWLSKVWGA